VVLASAGRDATRAWTERPACHPRKRRRPVLQRGAGSLRGVLHSLWRWHAGISGHARISGSTPVEGVTAGHRICSSRTNL